MIEEQSAPTPGAWFVEPLVSLSVECPTCGTGATAYLDASADVDADEPGPPARTRFSAGRPAGGRRGRRSRFEVGDTTPVLGVCAECGFGLIVDPALYSSALRRAA